MTGASNAYHVLMTVKLAPSNCQACSLPVHSLWGTAHVS